MANTKAYAAKSADSKLAPFLSELGVFRTLAVYLGILGQIAETTSRGLNFRKAAPIAFGQVRLVRQQQTGPANFTSCLGQHLLYHFTIFAAIGNFHHVAQGSNGAVIATEALQKILRCFLLIAQHYVGHKHFIRQRVVSGR